MKRLNYIFVVLVLTVCGCEDEVDAEKLLGRQEKVVINGFLSPADEIIKIQIAKTLPFLGVVKPLGFNIDNREEFVIKNAMVSLTDENNNTVLLTYSDLDFDYQIASTEFPILGGKKYTLQVIIKDQEYTASCQIPVQKVEDITASIVGDRSDRFGFSFRKLNVKYKDIKDVDNFYIVGATIISKDIEEPEGGVGFGPRTFRTDNIGDGSIISVDGEFFDSEVDQVVIQVANMEEILYQSLRASFLNYENNENPFGEIVIAPNNITGQDALGVFAGYQLTVKEMDLPQDN